MVRIITAGLTFTSRTVSSKSCNLVTWNINSELSSGFTTLIANECFNCSYCVIFDCNIDLIVSIQKQLAKNCVLNRLHSVATNERIRICPRIWDRELNCWVLWIKYCLILLEEQGPKNDVVSRNLLNCDAAIVYVQIRIIRGLSKSGKRDNCKVIIVNSFCYHLDIKLIF